MGHRKLAMLGIGAVTALAGRAFGQYTFNTLASFNGGNNGSEPMAGVTLSSDGTTLYGTTFAGGAYTYGEVFSVPVTGGTPTVLGSFQHSNGANPQAGVTLSGDGATLYGTTYTGGGSDSGEVFSIPVNAVNGTPMVLGSFSGSNGQFPEAPLTLVGSTLYGTASTGSGANIYGTVFSVPITGAAPTVVASFNFSNGYLPRAGLTLSRDGTTFYGTTFSGGSGPGAVFSVPVAGGTPTALYSFTDGNDGGYPEADLTLSSDGTTLYGTTLYGGAIGYGEVFSLPVAGGTPNVLYSFTGGTDGSEPTAGLTLSRDGTTLYGTTSAGGADGYGEVFSIPVAGGTPNVLYSFTDGTDGANPDGDLTLSADGSTLYGTTEYGGADGDGVVFSLSVPEPTSASLIPMAGLPLLLRRRRV
jgi:uncharacterized repeat protein (TIGR03803 family)